MSERTILENKYLDACYIGNVRVVKYMIRKECKSIKTDDFLLKCSNKACDGRRDCDFNNDHINVCKIILGYRYTSTNTNSTYHWYKVAKYACKTGCFVLVKLYLNTIEYDQVMLLWLLSDSCRSGNVDIIKFMMNKVGKNTLPCVPHIQKTCLENACFSGNMESIELFADDITNWKPYFKMACEGGNLEIVKFLIKNGVSSYTYCFYWAGYGGNIEIVDILIQKGATDFTWCLYGACHKGHLEIVKLLINEIDHHDIESCMDKACQHGHLEIVKFLVENGASDWNRYAKYACLCHDNNVEIIKLMIEKGANEFGYYLHHVCFHGLINFANLLIKKGATDWNNGLLGASKGGYPDLVKLMIDKGATDYNQCLLSNCAHIRNTDVCNILISHGASEFDCLCDVNDFKLYCLWLNIKGTKYITYSTYNDKPRVCKVRDYKWLRLLAEYPPCVLLVGSILSRSENDRCHVKRLPVELFALLDQY